MSITLSFHGGVDAVTGSCHLLRAGGLHVLIDCGMFQGGRQTEEMNYGDFGFDPASIDFLLLTHAHLDHCGRIPLIVKKVFNGKIITTSATFDIAKVVMMDSAQIQEEDFELWQRIQRRKGRTQREPLYTTLEALDSLRYFSTLAEYGKPLALNSRVKVTFRDAGHILGAAFLEVDVRGDGRLVFSGDLGNREKPVIRDPSLPSEADIIIIEGTYGGFSAHADRQILLEWLSHSRDTEHIFLVHGEKKSLTSFRKEINKRVLARKTHIPRLRSP